MYQRREILRFIGRYAIAALAGSLPDLVQRLAAQPRDKKTGSAKCSVEHKVKQLIIEQLGVEDEKLTRGADIAKDLGADDLDVTELQMAYEMEFQIEIPDQDCEKLSTVGSVVDYISSRVTPEKLRKLCSLGKKQRKRWSKLTEEPLCDEGKKLREYNGELPEDSTFVISGACTKDGRCLCACVFGAIHPTKGEHGFKEATQLYIDPSSCVLCQRCFEVCPSNAILNTSEIPPKWVPWIKKNEEYFFPPKS